MIGKTILHYKILEKLGQGGMGVVYRAEDTKLKRTVALKFLPPQVLASDEDRSRFVHEAQAAAALHHPNICTIYEINEAEGETFIAMACLEGRRLNDRMQDGPLDPTEVAAIALQIARGLKAAHAKQIVHRDIKSSNVMIDSDGRATIMDFGLAKSTRRSQATQRGTTLGTIAYMSPEQTRGDSVDHRTDIWSLGVLMYEMVTGKRPFRGDYDEAVIYSILNEEPPPLAGQRSGIPEDLVHIIERAMAKDVAKRYQTADEMVEDLELLSDDLKVSTASRSPARSRKMRRTGESFAARFFAPRVLVTLAIYLAVAWGLVMLVDVAVNRFILSPHLVKIALATFLSVIPTVWILAAWRKDRPTPAWTRAATIAIPLNFVAAVVVLIVLFAGRDIGAATTTVAVRNEAGETIERTVPKSEFRKSLALFFLDNESGDARYDWAQGAIAFLFECDLYQDQFLNLMSASYGRSVQRLREAGFSDWTEAPWNLKRKVADEANFDYLLTGSFTVEDGEWVVTTRIHDSRTSRLLAEKTHRGRDPFVVVDEAAIQVKRDLGIPAHHIETAQDFPVAEVITPSLSAMEHFAEGYRQVVFDRDWSAAAASMDRAIEADGTFTLAHFLQYQLSLLSNEPEKADASMRSAMQHIYKLPERIQFTIKSEYYSYVKDPEKQLAVSQMRVDLYPDDIDGRLMLASVYITRNEVDKGIEQFEHVIAIDPSRTEIIGRLASLLNDKGDFAGALAYYELWAEKEPKNPDAHVALGHFYRDQGKYDEARDRFAKALVLDPNMVRVIVDLGDIDGRQAEDESALRHYNRALDMAKTPQERSQIHTSLRDFYAARGQMEKSLEHLRRNWDERREYDAPVQLQIQQLEDLSFFVRAGRESEAFDIARGLEGKIAEPFDAVLSVGYLEIHTSLENPDESARALEGIEDFIETYDYEILRPYASNARGDIERFRSNYEAAIEYYEKALEIDATDAQVYTSIGMCYRELGRHDEAVAALEKTLRIYPFDPEANYEMALVYHALGKEGEAVRHLRRALDFWKNADPGYEPARKARQTLEEWGAS